MRNDGVNSYPTMPKFEEYKKKFEDYLFLKRENGIIEARMHTDGGEVKWSPWLHRALIDAWRVIGADLENEVLIITSTGDHWMGTFNREEFADWDAVSDPDIRYDGLRRPVKAVENQIFDIDIPTIGVINGPGALHINFALLCDLVLSVPDFMLRDHHFASGVVPGDSIGLCLQAFIGIRRAAYMMYMSNGIDAKTALEWGIINEILPKDKILARAWEIAKEIMKQPRSTRRLTSQIIKRPLKKLILEDYQLHITSEIYDHNLTGRTHDFVAVSKKWLENEKLNDKDE